MRFFFWNKQFRAEIQISPADPPRQIGKLIINIYRLNGHIKQTSLLESTALGSSVYRLSYRCDGLPLERLRVRVPPGPNRVRRFSRGWTEDGRSLRGAERWTDHSTSVDGHDLEARFRYKTKPYGLPRPMGPLWLFKWWLLCWWSRFASVLMNVSVSCHAPC